MAEDVITPGGNPITCARDSDAFPAQPEDVMTPEGNPIMAVRFQENVTQPEALFTPGKNPIIVVCDVDATPAAQDVMFTAGKSPIIPVRMVENVVQPEDVLTPLGNSIRVLQLVDGTGIFTGRRQTFDFTLTPGSLPAGATLTRASTGWYHDSAGVLQAALSNIGRWGYNPTTLALQGLHVEPAATNSVRNNSGTGVSAGTPGTAPTNWAVSSTLSSITRTIVGSGTEDGIPYVDYKFTGTASPAYGGSIQSETSTGIVAAQGQTWTASFFVRLTAGSLTGLTSPPALIALVNLERTAAGGGLAGGGQLNTAPTGAALRTQRFNLTSPLTNATTGCVNEYLSFTAPVAVAIDLTLRVGAAQMIQAAAASSPILTTAGIVTRAADVLTIVPPRLGTFTIDLVRLSGTTTVPSVVVGGGGYVVPTDPSPLRQVVFR